MDLIIEISLDKLEERRGVGGGKSFHLPLKLGPYTKGDRLCERISVCDTEKRKKIN